MLNSDKFNSTGFNSGTASLVLISASAAFSAGVSTDFTGGGYAVKAEAPLQASAQTSFASGVRTSLLTADLAGTSNNYFEPSVIRQGLGTWQLDAAVVSNPTLDIVGRADLSMTAQFFANTDFRTGEAAWISDASTLAPIANRVKFINASWAPDTVLTNDGVLQINGLMTGAWQHTSQLWSEPTVNRGLGFINHDGYGFLNGGASWDNQSFLTALFTTGGFIGNSSALAVTGTKIIDAGKQVWTNVADLDSVPVSEQMAQLDLTHTAAIEMDAVRSIYPIAGGWEISGATFRGKALMHRAAQSSLAINTTLAGITKSRLAAVVQLTHEASVEFDGSIMWQKGTASFTVSTSTQLKADRIQSTTVSFNTTAAVTFDGLRSTQVSMDMSGFGANLFLPGVLRLVDAPLARQFRVPAQNRTFIVPRRGKKFEVAA